MSSHLFIHSVNIFLEQLCTGTILVSQDIAVNKTKSRLSCRFHSCEKVQISKNVSSDDKEK